MVIDYKAFPQTHGNSLSFHLENHTNSWICRNTKHRDADLSENWYVVLQGNIVNNNIHYTVFQT